MNETIFKTDEQTEYKLAGQSVKILQQFLDWTKTVLPNPYAELVGIVDKLPPEMAKELFQDAKKKAALRGTVNDPDVRRLMETMEGAVHIFYLRLKPNHPELQPADTMPIISKAMEFYGADKWNEIFKKELAQVGDTKLTEEQAERHYFRSEGANHSS